MTEFKIDEKILKVKELDAVNALLMWGLILKKVNDQDGKDRENIHGFTAHCISLLKDQVDLAEFGKTFEESLLDERFFSAYKEIAENYVTKMMSFFKKKD